MTKISNYNARLQSTMQVVMASKISDFSSSIFKKLASQNIANFAIYASMVQYVMIWIFTDHQSSILLFGMIFWALRIPYFVKTGERAIVNESLFLVCADTLGIVTQSGSGQEVLKECIAIFGK